MNKVMPRSKDTVDIDDIKRAILMLNVDIKSLNEKFDLLQKRIDATDILLNVCADTLIKETKSKWKN